MITVECTPASSKENTGLDDNPHPQLSRTKGTVGRRGCPPRVTGDRAHDATQRQKSKCDAQAGAVEKRSTNAQPADRTAAHALAGYRATAVWDHQPRITEPAQVVVQSSNENKISHR